MTTLDRAFIKAFTESPPPGAPAAARPAIPVPQLKIVEPPRVDRKTPPSRTIDMHSGRTGTEGVAALPLSTFAPQPKIHDSCRPLLEIDRANWPAAAGDLLARAGRQWDRFAEQIVERVAEGQKCIAIASPERGDGRTTVSLALARQAAGRGLRMVVVDADFENPALARSCGVAAQTGWDDLVSSELALGEALISVVEENITLLPWRGRSIPLSELAGSMRAAGIFGTLREHYDLVVLDTLPLVGQTTMAEFAAFAAAIHLDALYLIQNVRTTSRDDLIATSAKLRRSGLPLLGVIENFASPAGADEPPGKQSLAMAGRPLAVRGS